MSATPSMPSDPLPPPHTQLNGEEEPLLGHRPPPPLGEGSVTTQLFGNLVSGSAPIAQIGGVALVVAVWMCVFSQPLFLFSAHPLLNSVAIALLLESTLLLQPTSSNTPKAKRTGAIVHSILNMTAFLAMYAAFIVMIVNKAQHHGNHFESAHARLGLITYILIFLQVTVGMVQFYFPSLVGGEERAKAIYKYHRISGYVIFLFISMTAIAVTYTPYVAITYFYLPTWFVLLCLAFVLSGVIARVNPRKLF